MDNTNKDTNEEFAEDTNEELAEKVKIILYPKKAAKQRCKKKEQGRELFGPKKM